MNQPATTLNLELLKARLWSMGSEDILWPQLMALLEAYAMAEARAAASPALDDAEAHRLRGRMGMCFDLKQDLEKLMAEAQSSKEQ